MSNQPSEIPDPFAQFYGMGLEELDAWAATAAIQARVSALIDAIPGLKLASEMEGTR
jgi:hypothetical protein